MAPQIFANCVHCGYLKPLGHTRHNDEDFYELAPPNREVHLFFRNTVSTWLNQTVGDENLRHMLKALTGGDWKTFGKYLHDMVADVLSVHDVAGEKPERVFHAFVLGLLFIGDRYRIRSNRESGYGRHDVLMIPKASSELGLVLEFKKIEQDENEDSEKALDSALAQIREKDYAAELRAAGTKRALGVGVVFEGKRVFVRGMELF